MSFIFEYCHFDHCTCSITLCWWLLMMRTMSTLRLLMILKPTDDRGWLLMLKLADYRWWSAQWPRGESCQRWSSVARWSITVGRSVHGCAEWSSHASNICCWSFDHLSYVCRSSDSFFWWSFHVLAHGTISVVVKTRVQWRSYFQNIFFCISLWHTMWYH